jgi:molecular chaperone DnaK
MPQIEVTFDIDANGIVHVSAKDKATGKEQSIRIQASGGLSEADIKRMQDEAERFKDEDRKKRELVETRNGADALIHSTEKSIKELGDKVGAADKTAIESAVADLKAAMTADNVDEIKAKSTALAQAALKLGEAVYGGQAGAAAGEGDGGGAGGQQKGGSGDNVVDADFEEVKDDKKKSA